MANTYTQIHLQLVFAVKYRQSLIEHSWKDELYRYITAIIQNQTHKLLIINGMPDHIHILIGMRPTQSLSDLMQHIKGDSSTWINERIFTKGKFEWQNGYGAFSYSKSQVPDVITYIKNQEQHHSKKAFMEEYLALLKQFEIDYDERYVFKDPL
ncbi:IS200/IS605 family transposase [Niabella sp. CC-SYL272]|uniref:IS200/IS605 family transposase n=1 Tax=Niabella agricola TaxID=2891571 RepID=UPI001F197990|nr:IS200/IS605 family transposase [Niabella agricola]MCF3111691.1 IS200/IS605 family transposase [Niabella agricola]